MRTPHLIRRSLFAIAVPTLLACALIASLSFRSASAATVGVDGGNDYFCSQDFIGVVCETDVSAGDTVTWTMVAGVHTVTQCNEDFSACPPTGGWDSGILTTGHTYSQTFAEPGTYAYRCGLHPSEMLGKIVVAAAATASPTVAATDSATAAPTVASVTPVVLPQTGGAQGGGTDTSLLVSLGIAMLAAAGLAFTFARRRAS